MPFENHRDGGKIGFGRLPGEVAAANDKESALVALQNLIQHNRCSVRISLAKERLVFRVSPNRVPIDRRVGGQHSNRVALRRAEVSRSNGLDDLERRRVSFGAEHLGRFAPHGLQFLQRYLPPETYRSSTF